MAANDSVGEDILGQDCPQITKGTWETFMVFSYWCGGVLLSIIATLGVIGNVIAAFVLTRKRMRNNFNYLLLALASFDMIFLVISMEDKAVFMQFGIGAKSYTRFLIYTFFLRPLYWISLTGSMLMIIAITFERFRAVHYHKSLNPKWPLLIVSALSVALNVPTFFEKTLVNNNGTLVVANALPDHHLATYFTVMNWFNIIITIVIPFLVLTILNMRVYMDIRSTKMAVARYSKSATTARERKEAHLAMIMMSYVVVFLICNFPRLICNVYEVFNISYVMRCMGPMWVRYMYTIMDLMLVINSSVNIMIYTAMSKDFRRELRALFDPCCAKHPSNSPSTLEDTTGHRTGTTSLL